MALCWSDLLQEVHGVQVCRAAGGERAAGDGRKEGKAAREDRPRMIGGAGLLLYSMRGGGAGFSCAGRLLVGGPACAAAAGVAASDALQV